MIKPINKKYPYAHDDELYDHVFNLLFFSYIKKSINLSAIQYKKRKNTIRNREILTLNTLCPNRNEEFINLIPTNYKIILEDNNKIMHLLYEISGSKTISEAINSLTDKQKEIIYKCIILDGTDTYVAKQLGISKQGVNKSKKLALNKLRQNLK